MHRIVHAVPRAMGSGQRLLKSGHGRYHDYNISSIYKNVFMEHLTLALDIREGFNEWVKFELSQKE